MKNEKKICLAPLVLVLAVLGIAASGGLAAKAESDVLQYLTLGLSVVLFFAGGYCLWQGRLG